MFNDSIIAEIDQADFATMNPGNLGAQVTIATNLLNTFMTMLDDDDLKQKIGHLRILVEQGVITSIPMRLQRMARQLKNGTQKPETALLEVVEMAKKYDPYYLSDTKRQKPEETLPEIILSESFK